MPSGWPVASGDADFDPYLAGKPGQPVAMFWRFVALVRACGPVIFELQRDVVALRGTRRIFATVRVSRTGLTGHLNLTRRLDDPRFRKVEPLTKRIMLHRRAIVRAIVCRMTTTTMQLDTALRDELAEIAKHDFSGATLAEAVRRLVREHRVNRIMMRYAELRSDPQEWASYRGEAQLADNAASDGLAPARDEYPEYNP